MILEFSANWTPMKLHAIGITLLFLPGLATPEIYKCPDSGGGIVISTTTFGPNCKAIATKEEKNISLQRGENGAFESDAIIAGLPIKCVIDTGASMVTVSESFAAQAQIKGAKKVKLATANGTATGLKASNVLVTLGKSHQRFAFPVEVIVNPGLDHDICLIGQNFLKHFRVEMRGNSMVLAKE